MAPQLTFGKPIDFSADVPIFPPATVMLTMITSRILWKASGRRLGWVPPPISALAVRIAVLAVAVYLTVGVVLHQAGTELAAAGSGTLFTPVNGLATTGIYEITRNPMYSGLIFFALPTLAFVVNTAWPILLAPLSWAYLHYVVIAAEEALLRKTFGFKYAAYCEKVPRWLI